MVIRYYILPNLLPPIVTMLGLSLPGLIGGSVILESIFGIEGMGQLFYMSAMSRDYPVIMGILMMSAFLTLIGNQIADAVLLKLNPFVKTIMFFSFPQRKEPKEARPYNKPLTVHFRTLRQAIATWMC